MGGGIEVVRKKDIEKAVLSQIGNEKLSGMIEINDKNIIKLIDNCLINHGYNTEIGEDNGQSFITYSKLNTSELRR